MAVPTSARIPLESGDHLTREEFHRRYLAQPDIRAELVEGVVYVSSPVGTEHSEPHSSAAGWLHAYRLRAPGVRVAIDGTVILPGDNEVQPDVCLYRLAPEGDVHLVRRREGRRTVTYLEGIPGVVFEVAASSASYDLHSKLRVYERAGVPEYIVWQVYDRRIRWFRLEDGRYRDVEPDARGVIESQVFPGLRLAVGKMLAGDDTGVLAALEGRR